MIRKISFVCAFAGAIAVFGASIANSAPVVEKTSIAAILKAKKETSASDIKTAEKKSAAQNKKATKTQTKASRSSAGKELPVIERRSAKVQTKAKKNTGSVAKTAKAGKKSDSAPYSKLIAQYASSYGVPLSLAHAVVRHESNYKPNARGAAGEIGLMQIKLATARGLGYTGSAKGLYDPATNVQFGMKYLAKAHKLGGGSTCGTILKYNAGHGAKRMNPTSAKYCSKVKVFMSSFS